MFTEMPPAEEISIPLIDGRIIHYLKKWDPSIEPAKLELMKKEYVTWNDGSLGCPMPGKNYTQALVPGYLFLIQYENLILEIHADRIMTRFAIPGVGFL